MPLILKTGRSLEATVSSESFDIELERIDDVLDDLTEDVNDISAADLRIQWLIKIGETQQ